MKKNILGFQMVASEFCGLRSILPQKKGENHFLEFQMIYHGKNPVFERLKINGFWVLEETAYANSPRTIRMG